MRALRLRSYLAPSIPAELFELRLVESWGPTPIQPLLARAGLASGIRDRVADALRSATVDPTTRERLAEFGLHRFAPIAEADYASAGPVAVLPPSSISGSI